MWRRNKAIVILKYRVCNGRLFCSQVIVYTSAVQLFAVSLSFVPQVNTMVVVVYRKASLVSSRYSGPGSCDMKHQKVLLTPPPPPSHSPARMEC